MATPNGEIKPVQPLSSMEEAWAEGDRLRAEGRRLRAEGRRLRAEGRRLWAEGDRLRAEGDLIVILTAQALYGPDAQIDWTARTGKRGSHE